LIGRDADLAQLRQLLNDERLITVTGTSGVGKTRLVLELARERDAARPGEVIWVDLAERRDLEGVRAQVALALGIATPKRGAIREALGRRGRTVLALDNMEQVIHVAAETVGAWLGDTTSLRCVVTSRERLRLPGEVVVELMPLGLPSHDGDSQAAAVRLWYERRRRSDMAAQAPADPVDLVADIVRQLDGIPLAIELAAARATLLSPADIRARLSRRFELLGHGARGAPARQATLRAAIDWSWNLLDERERAALAACAVFRGGFGAAAAEAVIGGNGALDTLQALREKSLLIAAPQNRGRLAMFQSIRDYAEERLGESGGEAEARLRHERFFVARAAALVAAAETPGGAAALAELDAERDNLHAVAERLLARGTPAMAELVTVLEALDLVAWTRGPIDAHQALIDGALSAAGQADDLVRGRLLELRGQQRANAGDLSGGGADVEAGLALAEAAGAQAAQARALLGLSWVRLRERRLEDSHALCERARVAARLAGDRRLEGLAAAAAGASPKERGDYARAEACYREGLMLLRAAGCRRHEGLTLTRLAVLFAETGRSRELAGVAEGALAIHQEFENHYAAGLVLASLGSAHHAERRLIEAKAVYERAVSSERLSGDRRLYGACLGYLGVASFELGELEAAEAHLEAARAALAAVGEQRHLALFYAFQAILDSSLGRNAAARSALAEATAHLQQAPDARVSGVRALAQALCEPVTAPAAIAAAEAPEGPATAAGSIDVRIALRLVRRAFEARAASGAPILVHPRGDWFSVGTTATGAGAGASAGAGERVACHRRPAIRRLLVRLALWRVQRPGATLSADELVAAGWPGEAMSADSARNRLHVTLNRLRELGLREVLQAHEGGYRLDPARAVVFADDDGDVSEV
jgi:predicted ATPase